MRYYGITIGPIDVTLNLASKPAGLWYASYMFSNITRMLCKYLSADERISILSPYYEKNELADGVGSYHDRTLFSFAVDDEEKAEKFVQEVIYRVKTEVGNSLAQDIKDGLGDEHTKKIAEYINRYLCIHYISVSDKEKGEKSVGETLSPYLDTLELYKSIPVSGEQNYLLTMFEGVEEDSNIYIRNSSLIKSIMDAGGQNFQLFVQGEKKIKNLAYISGAGKVKEQDGEMIPDTDGWKKWKYYAVVQADGDNLGKAVKKIRDDLEVSKVCKKYTKRCAKLIGEYGGMTIFAGGDDLLFLAPVQNRDGKTLFSLCSEISEVYEEEFKEINEKLPEEMKTTLSAGIAGHYWKFPLYETLKNARKQLFSYAKKTKNTLAVRLEKSSGSKIELKYPLKSEKEKIILKFLDSIQISKHVCKDNDGKEGESESTILRSVLYHIEEYQGLFQTAMEQGKEKTGICLDNMLEESKDLAYFKESKEMIWKLAETSEKSGNVYEDVISVLRLAHFFAEKEE